MPHMTPLPRPVRPWAVLGVAGMAAFMVLLDTQVLFVAFDDMRASFPAASFAATSWTLSAYTIALAAVLVPAGRMTDRFGRRRTFVTGLVVFTLASVACAFAPTVAVLVVFRVVQALGAAALMPSSLALVLSVFPPARVPVAVATGGAIGAFAAGIGPTVGALLVESWGGARCSSPTCPSDWPPSYWRFACCPSRARQSGPGSPTRSASRCSPPR